MARHPATLPPAPGAIKPHVWRDGRQFFSLPELARRRGVSRQAASKWAHRHPDHTVLVGIRLYAEDIRS